jgi:hypothetical protein
MDRNRDLGKGGASIDKLLSMDANIQYSILKGKSDFIYGFGCQVSGFSRKKEQIETGNALDH